MPIASYSLGKRGVKVPARRRCPLRVRALRGRVAARSGGRRAEDWRGL